MSNGKKKNSRAIEAKQLSDRAMEQYRKAGLAGGKGGRSPRTDPETKMIIEAYKYAKEHQSGKTGRKVTDDDLAAALKILKAKKRNKTQSMKHGGKVRSYNFIN